MRKKVFPLLCKIHFFGHMHGSSYIVLIVIIALTLSSGCKAQSPLGDSVNVQSYGANGNDLSDDNAAFQKALDYLEARNGGTLYIPNGTYYFTRTKVPGKAYCINVPSNVKLLGEDKSLSILKLADKQLAYTRLLYFDKSDNIKMNNITVDGNYSKQTKKEGKYSEHMHGIFINQATNITIKNCKFLNTCGDGITIRGPKEKPSTNILITKCFFDGNQRNGLTLGTGFKNMTIDSCYFGKNIVHSPIDSEPHGGICQDVLICNNMFDSNVTLVTLGGHVYVDNYEVKNNHFKNAGLFIVRCRNSSIHDNVFEVFNTKRPVISVINDNSGVRIFNNTITTNIRTLFVSATRYGIPRNVEFFSNNITSSLTNSSPILIQGSSDFKLYGNNITVEKGLDKFPIIQVKANIAMSGLEISKNTIMNKGGAEFIKVQDSQKKKVENVVIKNNSVTDDKTP